MRATACSWSWLHVPTIGNLLVKPELPEGYVPLEQDGDLELKEPADWLERYGRVPLPPYIRDGQMVDSDIERYQTVFAREKRKRCRTDRRLALHRSTAGKIKQSGSSGGRSDAACGDWYVSPDPGRATRGPRDAPRVGTASTRRRSI